MPGQWDNGEATAHLREQAADVHGARGLLFVPPLAPGHGPRQCGLVRGQGALGRVLAGGHDAEAQRVLLLVHRLQLQKQGGAFVRHRVHHGDERVQVALGCRMQ
jgi:hypothetical protein